MDMRLRYLAVGWVSLALVAISAGPGLAASLDAQAGRLGLTDKGLEEAWARVSQAYVDCMNRQGDGFTGERDCTNDEQIRWNRKLDALIAGRARRLSPPRASVLRRSQSHWLRRRDSYCRRSTVDYGIGTDRISATNDCVLTASIRRAERIRRFK